MSQNGTSRTLCMLRALMCNKLHVPEVVHAYIVPTGDAHQSEYVAECDKRRDFLSGFTGSAGTAIVTTDKAALWTDGRYHLQAEQQLDGDWTLMKDGLHDTPTQAKWLNKVLPINGVVGCDPTVLSNDRWKSLGEELRSDGHDLIPVNSNLVDLVWNERPPPPHREVIILDINEVGVSWQDKVQAIQEKLKEKNASAVIFTALDEVAWLFNLRGSDIVYNPVFFSFTVVTLHGSNLFIDESQLTDSVKRHLNGVKIHPYTKFYNFVSQLAENGDSKKIWVNDKSSFAVCSQIQKNIRLVSPSPVAAMKAVKNSVEMKGMERAHVKDAVALCEFFHWFEKEVPKGKVTEVSAADQAEFYRSQQADFVSLSFSTISSTGSNGAIIHYKPTKETDRRVSTEEIYLIDSGAQYRDGTTDVTRTVHLGVPTKHEQECFTRVLKGHINLAAVVFPNGVKGHMLDTLARTSLWQVGLDYQHGTGHGVGAFLNVHEGPCGISYRVSLSDVALEENMILSDEPGYYEAGKFGIRLENLVKVVKANTKFNFANKGYLGFEPITLVPIQTKMIDASLLSNDEISWLNQYHALIRQVVGDELKVQGKGDVYQWLLQNTQPLG